MKLKELESLMQVSNSFDEFEGRVVADLGCGTGMLAIGAAVLGASHVVAVDVDQDALDLAKENVAGIYDDDDDEPSPIDFIKADVRALGEQQPRIVADTVIMNPPFGTRQKGTNRSLRVHYLLP
ncbi:hypothetical protein QBZ16_003106 [Prototheca wickerhamii]|uniref:Methyltransferase small domain-containing protein n=1 Tax=Prototheca wickerhamii TaxID=3111 RepID=A0AAD9IJ02_PROWI|nr:hypothetical protein QBZ16_003106 [Prototheca wickerhamii]